MTNYAVGYTAEEILREIILDDLRTIERHLCGWYDVQEDKYMNAVCTSTIERSLESLCIVKDGYRKVISSLHLIERRSKPIIQLWTKDGWVDINMPYLCAIFDVDYYTMVKRDR